MVIPTTELSLITMGLKGDAKGMHKFVGANAGILRRRTSSAPSFLPPPSSATSRSRFSTCALIQRNKSSPRSTYSDVEFRGAVCTIGTYYPAKGSWSCKVKPAAYNLTAVINSICFLLFVSMILWKKFQTKKLKSLLALLLMGMCIGLATYAAKGNDMAIFLVKLFDKSGKIYKVLGHLFIIFGGPL